VEQACYKGSVCGLCGVLMTSHWTESGSGRRARVFRTALLNRVLDHFGLRLDDWSGSVYVLRDRKGRAEVVGDLGALWQTAERMLGRPLDPLDPALVQTLAADRG
jgi:hypothetical protein